MATCIDLGTHTVGVTIDALGGEYDLAAMTPVLEAMAEAAIPHADFIVGPAVAKFPTLDISMPTAAGKWVVDQQVAIGGRPRDTLVRLDSGIPLELSFAEYAPYGEECPRLFGESFLKDEKRTLVKAPAYAGGRWYPAAGADAAGCTPVIYVPANFPPIVSTRASLVR
jgi:hypothetical protein